MPPRPRSWLPDALLLAAFAALTIGLARGRLLAFDVAAADWADAHRPAPVYWTLRVLNYLGQGGQVLMPVAIILTALVWWRTRSWWAPGPFAAAFALTYVTVGPAKVLFHRAAPHFAGPDREIMFNPAAHGELAMSYPSGHMANALAWYFVITLLLGLVVDLPPRARLLLRVVPPSIVLVTTTYLAFHWVTDSVAGLLIGLVLGRLLARVPWEGLIRPTSRTSSPA
jgi:membrane-associated phospholipid phosphatase